MTLAIILNMILCGAVVVGVVAPLAWAILTQHRDETVTVATAHGTRQARARTARRPRRPLGEPIVWPVR
jgi:hypothetical protein